MYDGGQGYGCAGGKAGTARARDGATGVLKALPAELAVAVPHRAHQELRVLLALPHVSLDCRADSRPLSVLDGENAASIISESIAPKCFVLQSVVTPGEGPSLSSHCAGTTRCASRSRFSLALCSARPSGG